MVNYETVFIITPVLSDAQTKETVEKFKNLLIEQGAEIVNEELWGLRKLAYTIDNKTTGYYVLIEFKADPTVVETLEINFRRDERVIRFLTVRLDKFALEYAEKRRKRLGSKAKDGDSYSDRHSESDEYKKNASDDDDDYDDDLDDDYDDLDDDAED